MARRALTTSDQDKAEMLRMYVSDNKGIVEIGKKFDVSPSTVSRFLKVQGAPMRKRGTRTNRGTETIITPHTPEAVEVKPKAPAPDAHHTECFPKVNEEEFTTFSNE